MTSSRKPPRILIADDQPDVLESLRLLLKTEGYAIDLVDSPERAVAAAADRDFDAALVDLNYSRDMTSGAEGLDLVSKLQTMDSTLYVRNGICSSGQQFLSIARHLRRRDHLGRARERGLWI